METIIIYESKKKMVRITMAGLLMTLASVMLFVMGIYDSDSTFKIVGIIGTVFFGANFIYQMIRQLSKRKLLVIGKDAIEVCDSESSVGKVLFDEIEEFKVISNGRGHRFIGVMLKDVEELLKRIDGSKKKAITSNIKNNYPPILIWVDTAKDKTLDEILIILEERLNKRL